MRYLLKYETDFDVVFSYNEAMRSEATYVATSSY